MCALVLELAMHIVYYEHRKVLDALLAESIVKRLQHSDLGGSATASDANSETALSTSR